MTSWMAVINFVPGVLILVQPRFGIISIAIGALCVVMGIITLDEYIHEKYGDAA